jgi:hypothetical protein
LLMISLYRTKRSNCYQEWMRPGQPSRMGVSSNPVSFVGRTSVSFIGNQDVAFLVRSVGATGATGPAGTEQRSSVAEAPNDGQRYARQSLNWSVVTGGGGGAPATVAPLMDGGVTGTSASRPSTRARSASTRPYIAGDCGLRRQPGRAEGNVTYVDAADALKANIASPTFTSDPKAPTAAPGDDIGYDHGLRDGGRRCCWERHRRQLSRRSWTAVLRVLSASRQIRAWDAFTPATPRGRPWPMSTVRTLSRRQ